MVLKFFSERLMCMRQNFKLLCCAAYILTLIVPICLFCWPNLWCSGVFSAEFRSFRKNSAKPDISRKYGSASRIFWKIRLRGLDVKDWTSIELWRCGRSWRETGSDEERWCMKWSPTPAMRVKTSKAMKNTKVTTTTTNPCTSCNEKMNRWLKLIKYETINYL